MTPTEQDKPTNSDYVALWQLQDIEETIQDASPEEMPELYDKLEALSSGLTEAIQKLITADRKRVESEARKVTGDTSDGYHTFNELYDYRRVYNAALFNEWASQCKYDVHKSWKHSDGEDCFDGGWFIVVAELPTGQVSNHYEAQYWDSFAIPSKDIANEYDGHTPKQALDRIAELKAQQEEV